MPSLQSVVQDQSTVFVTQSGRPFLGKVLPAGEGEIPNFLFAYPRLILRTTEDSPLAAKEIIVDEFDRYFLVAEYDAVALAGSRLWRSYQLFQMPFLVPWTRMATVTDMVTDLPRATATPTNLGNIRCSIDLAGREYPDRASNAREEILRVITGSPIQLNDKVDGKIVKKVNLAFGVYVGEIQ